MSRALLAATLSVAMAVLATPASAFNETLTDGTSRDLSVNGGDSGGADGVADFSIVAPAGECGNITKFTHLNGSARAFPASSNYATMSYAKAVAVSYPSTGPFCPSSGDDHFYVRTSGANAGSSADDRFYKLRVNSTGSGGANVDYEWLGTGVPSPPNSDFTFTTYDLYALFTDTSSGAPSAWAWDFADSGSSTQQDPRHRYLSAGNRTVSLTASNVGGSDATPAAKSVVVAERPSISAAVGATLDVDGDGSADLQVVAGSGCGGGSSHLETRNGAGVEMLGSDYRSIDAGDIAGSAFAATNFCMGIDYLDGFMVQTGAANIYRAWIARNDGSGMRLEVALLQAGGPPPPSSDFAFSSYDLIVDFEDTSTGDPASWDWDFGDGNGSVAQSPRHRYASAGLRSACLTASNAGGDGAAACADVAVSEVPSILVGPGSAIDFDGDGDVDLSVQSAAGACGAIVNSLATQNQARFAVLGSDYRAVVAADAIGISYGSGAFCVEVDYLDAFLVRTASGSVYRAWTARNDGTAVRLEFALLTVIPPLVFANGFE